jgi:hypothetical protein
VLIRVLQNGTWAEVGYTVAHQAVRRPVTFRVNRNGESGDATLDGLALIDENDEHPGELSIEALARQVGAVTVKIERTEELLWIPVAAHRDELVGMWTVECVPLVAWFRLSQRTDTDILRLASGIRRPVSSPTFGRARGARLGPNPVFSVHGYRPASSTPTSPKPPQRRSALNISQCNALGVKRNGQRTQSGNLVSNSTP